MGGYDAYSCSTSGWRLCRVCGKCIGSGLSIEMHHRCRVHDFRPCRAVVRAKLD